MEPEELFISRFSELIKSNNYTLEEIGNAIGIKSKSTISKYLSGNIKNIKRSQIIKLANFFNVSPAWLAGFSNEKYVSKANKIPVLNKIDISNILAEKNISDYINIKLGKWIETDKCFAIAAPDNDMLPLLGKGDLAIIHIQNEIENGNTALIYLKDTNRYTIKKVVETKTALELYSMNPTIREIQTTYENIIIIGRVIKADVESAFE